MRKLVAARAAMLIGGALLAAPSTAAQGTPAQHRPEDVWA